VDLRTGPQQQNLRPTALGLGQDVGPLVQAIRAAQDPAVQGRNVLTGQGQGHGALLVAHGNLPGLDHLVGVAGPQDHQIGDGPQGGQMLDRLVGRPILAQTDAVVRPDVDHGQAHQGGKAHGPPHVVGEDQEGRAVGDQASVSRHAVQDCAHAVLADPEVDVAAFGVLGAL